MRNTPLLEHKDDGVANFSCNPDGSDDESARTEHPQTTAFIDAAGCTCGGTVSVCGGDSAC
ncbi:MAG: hypothetical protein HQL95_07065 [Magnetococcales bacterium]|nr:hypothetical protein [Magnetococcales bacterium]